MLQIKLNPRLRLEEGEKKQEPNPPRALLHMIIRRAVLQVTFNGPSRSHRHLVQPEFRLIFPIVCSTADRLD